MTIRVSTVPGSKEKIKLKWGWETSACCVDKVGDMKKGKNKIANRSKNAQALAMD